MLNVGRLKIHVDTYVSKLMLLYDINNYQSIICIHKYQQPIRSSMNLQHN